MCFLARIFPVKYAALSFGISQGRPRLNALRARLRVSKAVTVKSVESMSEKIFGTDFTDDTDAESIGHGVKTRAAEPWSPSAPPEAGKPRRSEISKIQRSEGGH